MIADMKSSWFRSIALILFHLLFLVVPLLFTSVNDELFEFNKMLAVYVFAILIGGCWLAQCVLRQRILWKRTPLDIPIAVFLLSQLVSTLFSIDIHTSLFGYYSRFNGGLFSVFAYIFLYYMFTIMVDRKHLKTLLSSLLVGGVLSAAYAVPEHFGHSPSCLMFTGKFDVACWVQDVKTRVFGTFGQPNWLAAYLGMLLPLAIVNSKHVETKIKLMEDETAKDIFQTLIRLGIAILFLAVLFFTGSRSGLIAVATGLLMLGAAIVYLWRAPKEEKLRKSIRSSLVQYGTMLGITMAAVIALALIIPNPIQEKVFSLIPHKQSPAATAAAPAASSAPAGGSQLEVGGSESGDIRSVVWRGALRVWARYPLFGSGVETFAYSYYKDRLVQHNLLSEWDFLYNKAHNEFLNYLATTGLFGFLSYSILLACIILFPLRTVFQIVSLKEKKWKNHADTFIHDCFVLLSLSAGVIIVSISNFFGFSTVMVSLLTFIFPAFAVIISRSYREEEETMFSAEGDALEVSGSQWVALVVTGAVVLLPALYVRRLWLADVEFAKGKQLDNFGQFETGYGSLLKATQMVPEEANFHDEFSYNLASLAVKFVKDKDATKAADFASESLKESDTTVALNKVHTNFWKTRVKVFLTLAGVDQHFYAKAEEALNTAHGLSPTDPKVVYYLAIIAQLEGKDEQYQTLLLKAIELKPNFEDARNQLAKYYEGHAEPQKALEQYEYMVKFINPNNRSAQDRIASLSAQLKLAK